MTTARIYPAHDGGFWLDTPYDKIFIGELKNLIAYPGRKWDKERRQWWVSAAAVAMAESIARRHYDNVEKLDAAPPPPPPPPMHSYLAYNTLHLMPSAPPEVTKAAYRAMAMLHHPDRGGNVEMMKRINQAWECLNAEVRR
jgi:hypothetical protein